MYLLALGQNATPSAEDLAKAIATYKQLDALFVNADNGVLSDANETILTQYISQHEIPFINVAISYVQAKKVLALLYEKKKDISWLLYSLAFVWNNMQPLCQHCACESAVTCATG